MRHYVQQSEERLPLTAGQRAINTPLGQVPVITYGFMETNHHLPEDELVEAGAHPSG